MQCFAPGNLPLAWLSAVLPAPLTLPDLTPTACGRGQEALHRTAGSQAKSERNWILGSRSRSGGAAVLRRGCPEQFPTVPDRDRSIARGLPGISEAEPASPAGCFQRFPA